MKASRIAYAGLALITLLLALCLSACHSSRPVADTRPNAEIQAPRVPLDTGAVVVQPPRTLFQKLTGQPAAPAYRLPASTPVRIGKKSQVTIIDGSGNTVGQTGTRANSATGTGAKLAVAGKKAQLATDSAAVLNTGGGAAAVGTGASATGGATVTKPGFWATVVAGLSWWWLLIPAGYAVYRFRKSIPFLG